MTGEPSAYPKPVASPGGPGYRTLRGSLGTDVRQPDLGGAPKVATISGFGAQAGAYIRAQGTEADRSQGIVVIHGGLVPSASGTVVLEFAPNTPGAGMYVTFADWASFGAQSIAGTRLTLNWTANRVLGANERLRIAYQWAISR